MHANTPQHNTPQHPATPAFGVQPRPGAARKPRKTVIKLAKAASAAECTTLEQLPNIGPSLAADLRLIGIRHPRELIGKDAFVLYQKLSAATGRRQDPCVLDTFMAATDFMRGAAPAPWWQYTAHRKALYGQIETAPAAGADVAVAANTIAQGSRRQET
jgi:hypothetical protein